MKTLYLDCSMGAAGDMLTAALLELVPEQLPLLLAHCPAQVRFSAEPAEKCGIRGTHMRVLVHGEEEGHHKHHEHHHHHSTLRSIAQQVADLGLPPKIESQVLDIYMDIAQAESTVHGVPVDEVHFHEVGTLDALADITAVCLLMDVLAPDEVVVSPVHVGSGQVRCAHGILPVPAPATALLLQGIPTYGGTISGELCTPTGAALLRHFATRFGPQPVMAVNAIGYGMGKKDFPVANCLRAFLGTVEDATQTVLELSCNLDDITAEDLAFAAEQLLSAGALDVWAQPIGMKKSRPGTMLCLLCREADRQTMVELLFRHTTTLGVREECLRRHTLSRQTQTVETEFGPVRQKISEGHGVCRRKTEWEDLARIARAEGLSLAEVRRRIDASTIPTA